MARELSIDAVLLGTAETMDVFIRNFMSSLITATREANSDVSEDAILKTKQLLRQLVDYSQPLNNVELSDELTDEYLYHQLEDVVDILLEGADDDFDEFHDSAAIKTRVKQSLALDKDRLLSSNSQTTAKPQTAFAHEICNTRGVPFRPRLRHKPFASTPLDLRELRVTDKPLEDDAITAPTYFAHPYETELRSLQYTPWQLADASSLQPVLPSPNTRPLAFIDAPEELPALVAYLATQRELAVDLEHHSHRSFQGFTCLMQLSTRDRDFILDTLALRPAMHQLLEVFANPSIVKLFHGCESDILWLQKDFGIYVVNCFDTYHAAKLLRYPALSLAHLVQVHCGVSLNKKYQLSDWRQRPLSAEMLQYARADTMYLLAVYDCLRKDVCRSHGEEGLIAILDATRHICLKRYELEPFVPSRYRRVLEASSRRFATKLNATQDMLLAALFDWRDATARTQDESPLYIMSNAELIRLASAAPRTQQDLLNCAPLSAPVLAAAVDILRLISDKLALPAPTTKPRSNASDLFIPVLDADVSSLRSLHKTSHPSVLSFIPSTPRRVTDPISASPVLGTHEIYRLAGWSTPGQTELRQASSPEAEYFPAAMTGHTDLRARLEATRADAVRSLAAGITRESFHTETVKAAPVTSKVDERLVDDGFEALLEVPKSFAEIYDISNRNRVRGKEKKRKGDETGDAASQSVGEAAGALLDSCAYFKGSDKPLDASAEATVNMFESMGWVHAADKAAVLEAYRNEQKGYQEAQGDSKGASSPPRSSSHQNKEHSPNRASKGSSRGINPDAQVCLVIVLLRSLRDLFVAF